ncbi:MAG: fatty acyl-AMP ligase [Myxococcota bacterium]
MAKGATEHPLAPYDPEWTVAKGLRAASGLNPLPDAGYTFIGGDGTERRYTFEELRAEADRRGRHLLALGLRKGDRCGFIVPDGEEFVLGFLGAASVGIVPVPLYPPLGFGKLDAYVRDTARILRSAGARMLVTSKRVQPILWSLIGDVDCLEELVVVEKLEGPPPADAPDPEEVQPDDLAFIQFTSGSTSAPKGVMVTHRSLGANGHGIMTAMDTDVTSDFALSWLPLYHDMGLIGFVISPLTVGLQAGFLPTTSFIKRPSRWMQLMSDHRATITFAPNFAYGLATKRTRNNVLEQLDLSHVRILGAGAEPNHPGTLQAFLDHFAPAGLKPEAMFPVYGMAEATLAISFSRLDEPMRVDLIDGPTYQEVGRAVPVEGDGDASQALEFVGCGWPFPGHEVVVVDEDGRELPDRTTGEIVFRGPSVAAGYFDNDDATKASFRSDGLRTGDLGYVVGGEVYVTGRKKDLIILHGRNYDPQSIEWAVAEIEGVRRGNVIAFSRPGDDSEELVVVAETKEDEPEAREALARTVRSVVRDEFSLNPADVRLYDAGVLPKTTSGKLQRAKARQQYLAGTLGVEGVRTLGERGQAVTVARHVARSTFHRVRHGLRQRASLVATALRSGAVWSIIRRR